MSVYTKLGHKRIHRLYADVSCYHRGELVQVWTVLEDRLTPMKYFLSDLIADGGHDEILDIVRANSKPVKSKLPRLSIFRMDDSL